MRKGEPPCDAAEQHWLQRDMVDDVRPLAAIEPGDSGYRPRGAEEPVAAPPPGDRAQGETLVADLFAMRAHPGRDDYLEAGLARSAGDRETV